MSDTQEIKPINSFEARKAKRPQIRSMFQACSIRVPAKMGVDELRAKLVTYSEMKRYTQKLRQLYDQIILGRAPQAEVIKNEVVISDDVVEATVAKLVKNNIKELAKDAVAANLDMANVVETHRTWRDAIKAENDRATQKHEELRGIHSQLSNRVEGIQQAMGEIDKIAKAAISRELNQYRPVKLVNKTIDKEVTLNDEVYLKEFERLLQLATMRKNIMMVGPAGCGKTHAAEQIFCALVKAGNLPKASQRFHSVSCTEGMSESQVSGWLLPVGAGGKFEYVPVGFVECYEKGGVFLIDEIDSGDPNVLTFLNKALANDAIEIPQRHKEPIVKKHKDFICIAAANTFGTGGDAAYVGRNQLDAATLDRFKCGMVYVDYSDMIEAKLVDPEILQWGRVIRRKIQANKLTRIMSTRVMRDFTEMKQAYDWDMNTIQQQFFTGWSNDEIRRVTE